MPSSATRPGPAPPPTSLPARSWRALVGFVVLYLVAAWLGRLSRVDGTPLALVWPAAAVGYLWLTWSARQGRLLRDVPALAAAAGAVNWATGASAGMALVFAGANAVQALVAVLLVLRIAGDWRLRTGAQLGALVTGSLAGAAAGALVGTTAMSALLGVDLSSTFAAWVVRNASNTFVFAAFAVRVTDLGWRSLASRRTAGEWVATVVVLTACYGLVFGQGRPVPLSSFVLPLSMWVALRFSTTAAAAHVLLAGILVVTATAGGLGPFQDQPVVLRVVLAQAFVATVGLVAMVLALHRDERNRLLQALGTERDGHAAQSALLETVLDTVDVAVVACDARGHLTLFNRAARQFHGTDADPTVDPDRWAARFDLFDRDGTTVLDPEQVPLRVALRDGRVEDQVIVIAPHALPAVTVRVDGRRMLAADGTVLGAVVAQTDITRLQASEQQFRQAFLAGPTPSARLDPDGRIEQVNPALRRLLALPSRALVGQELVQLVAEDDRRQLSAALAAAAGPVEARFTRADGTSLWCEVAATPLAAAATAVSGELTAARLLVQVLDVHARRSREQRMELAAQHDPLTGLGNRAVATARLADLARQPHQRQTVLAYLDLDGFKQVNDSHGHHAGDAVLIATAERLRTVVRSGDDVVRLGGDEFLLICPVQPTPPAGGTPPDDDAAAPDALAEQAATALSRRVEALLAEPVEHDGALLSTGVSVGTLVVAGGEDPADVLTRADHAMYERKRARKISSDAVQPAPDAERRRLETLRGLDVLDTAPDPVLDKLVRVAATVAGVPTSLVSLVDEHRQWFQARCGLHLTETSRDMSFCASVVAGDSELHVHDAITDPRFADNPLVTGEPGIRSYAGFPLRHPDGSVLGSLCVIGYQPGSLDDAQRQVLRILAGQVLNRLAPPGDTPTITTSDTVPPQGPATLPSAIRGSASLSR